MSHVYGWRPDTPDHRDLVMRIAPHIGVPANLDLRAQQPPVFDQGSLGSCTGNGIAAELEAQAIAQCEVLCILSRLFIYWNERQIEGTVDEDAGASIRDGIKSVAKLGACPETAWPYDIAKFTVQPSEQCYKDALQYRAVTYQRVPQKLSAIKQAIASGHGIVLGISIYDSFESDAVTKAGVVPIPRRQETLLGGHCVRLVGYTDDGLVDIPKQHFIGQNSWGVGWGLKGYFAIPYTYVLDGNLADDLWDISAVA